MSPEEEEEVRTLLSRHQDRIIADLSGTELLAVLVKNSVISSSQEELLKINKINDCCTGGSINEKNSNVYTSSSISSSTSSSVNTNNTSSNINISSNLTNNSKLKIDHNVDNKALLNEGEKNFLNSDLDENKKIDNSLPSITAANSVSTINTATIAACCDSTKSDDNILKGKENYELLRKEKCLKLIDLIARDGFEKFKQFCYAIENECPQLIEDLINDRLKNDEEKDKSTSEETKEISKDESKETNKKEDASDEDKSEDRSRRSISYSGSIRSNTIPLTPPVAAPRRSSLLSNSAQSTLQSSATITPADSIQEHGSPLTSSGIGTNNTNSISRSSPFRPSSSSLTWSPKILHKQQQQHHHHRKNLTPLNVNIVGEKGVVDGNNDIITIENNDEKVNIYQSHSAVTSSDYALRNGTNINAITSNNATNSNYSSLFCHASSASSPAVTRKRDKLLHRFSDAATLGRRLRRKKNANRACRSMTETIEILADPVVEDDFFGDRTSWEYHTVSVTRVPGYGFGIAVSGGRDNPHFANGDPSIAVSDVLKGGPAEDRLQVNDRIISVNGVSLENVEYATAVQVLRDSGNTVTLVVKRRVPNPNPHQHSHSLSSVGLMGGNASGIHNASNLGGLGQSVPSIVNTGRVNTNINAPLMPPQQPQHQQMPAPAQPIKVVLTKNSKKEDFGIVLGCRLFVKEISAKARDQLIANGYTLQEGDIVTRIHNTNCNDSMSIKEAKKIIDGCKERLNLVVLRDITNQLLTTNAGSSTMAGAMAGANNNNALNNSGVQSAGNLYPHHAQQVSTCSNNLDDSYLSGGGGGGNYSSQNLYVQPPTRGNLSSLSGGGVGGANTTNIPDEKSNLIPRGRTRGPLMDVSTLSQLDRPSTPQTATPRRPDEPPRPPPPRGEDFYSSRRQLYDDDSLQRTRQSAEPRFISFQKEGSVGIRLTGGNEAGIFVTAVQPGSPASLQGLTPGDKILKVNDMDMQGVTREEAVLFLLSLQDRIDLIVQHCKDEYEEAVTNQRGDSFHIKTHFHCENPSKGEMSFKAGDVFRVVDTLHNGVVGSWQVLKIGRGHQELQRGVIPNKSRAEELATAQFNATKKEMNASESRGNFFRRRRSTHRRSKSLSRENWDDVVFSDSISKFPAYERVVLRHPGFVRPVVLFGPVSDIAREKLTKDFPDKFTAPLQDDDKSNSKCKIVRLSNIRDIMDRGKHALLDITPNAVDRLNYAQFYPIVIFLKSDTKHIIKQLRHGLPKSAHKSSKKLLEQCQKLERVWSHIFSTIILLNESDSWYRKLREAIDLQQSGAVWMSESKPLESLSDDFLFPMTTSRLSYASSPESDLEMSPGPSASLSLGNLPQLVKSSSDPSIATNQDNLDRDRDIGEGLPPPYTNPYEHSNQPPRRSTNLDNKYSFPNSGPGIPSQTATMDNSTARPQSIYGMNAPDLPPRIDRASKPPGGVQPILNATGASGQPGIVGMPPPSASQQPSQRSNNGGSGGTYGRSAQERLFGKASIIDENGAQDEYATARSNTMDPIERPLTGQNSLDRQHSQVISSNIISESPIKGAGTSAAQMPLLPGQNGSYDSVSSYDSYNTTQLSVQNIRLGPNAPDDLKSVPAINGRPPPPATVGPSTPEYRSVHDHHHSSRALSGSNDLNRQNSPGRLPYHDINTSRNIDGRNLPNVNLNIPQRPTNLGIENSPRKVIETKTDYGKYSRNNSASQADYSKVPKSPHMSGGNSGQIPASNGTSNGNSGSGTPFKPVPPPKPKNYRPPMQGQMNWGGDNGEPSSPRSPNGFFYPPTPSHYHHTQTASTASSHNLMSNSGGNGGGPNSHPPIHAYGHFNNNQQPSYPTQSSTNGYSGGNAQYGSGPYMGHRGPPMPIGDARQPLDLAGSREQRGSAFELYRKPQIGATGHHHNISDMEPYERYGCQSSSHHYQHLDSPTPGRSVHYSNEMNERNYRHFYANQDMPPPLPPPLPPLKTKKKSVLKSPLAALKNAIIKSTRPLRRMNSMVEPERKMKPCLRRQHSMSERGRCGLEARIGERINYPNEDYLMQQHYQVPIRHDHQSPSYMNIRHEPFCPQQHDLMMMEGTNNGSTYQNLESEDIYGSYGRKRMDEYEQMMFRNGERNPDDLYANRALIDLERRQAELRSGGRRIVRRHSMADRSSSNGGNQYRQQMLYNNYNLHQQSPSSPSGYDAEIDVYQSRHGSYLVHGAHPRRAPGSSIMIRRRFYPEGAEEPTYQSRREMHRSHLYQSRKEMQERIAQGKKEIEREFSPQSSSQSERDDRSDRESIYQSKRGCNDMTKDSDFRATRSKLREQIYQSRQNAMESMAEPIYVSKREITKHEPIYESKEETTTGSTVLIASSSSKENEVDEKNDEKIDSMEETLTSSSKHSDLQRSDETVIENPNLANVRDSEKISENPANRDSETEETLEPLSSSSTDNIPSTSHSRRTPFHISNIIKRTAPPPPPPDCSSTADLNKGNASENVQTQLGMSQTSIETNYTSQTSLPVGPPNASSTPFPSDLSLLNDQVFPEGSHEEINGKSTTKPIEDGAVGGQRPLTPVQFPSVPREPSTTKGIFDEKGGTLCDNLWKVSLIIPPGAIPPGVKQEVYFTVSDPRMSESVGGPPLDMENGETMLSPLVMCGPQGLEFLTPVTLNIPHCAGRTASLGLSLKATDSEKNLQTNWDNIDLPSNTAAHTVSVKVDHF